MRVLFLICIYPFFLFGQEATVKRDVSMLVDQVSSSNRNWNNVASEYWSIARPYAQEGKITKKGMARLKELYGIAKEASLQTENLITVMKVGSHVSEYPGILACGKISYDAKKRAYLISLHGGFAGEERDVTWRHWIWITEKGVIDSIGKSPMPSQ